MSKAGWAIKERLFNVWGAVPFLLVGLFALHHARSFPGASALDVGPRFFPSAVAWAMVGLALALVGLSLTGQERLAPSPVPARAWRDWAFTASVAVASMAVWRASGYLAACFVVALAVTAYFERHRRWWHHVLFAASVTAAIWIIFSVLLGVPVRWVG